VTSALAKGVLIAFEGIDGTGKSTQAKLLAQWAMAQDLEVIQTREPTTGPWGLKVRNSKLTGRLEPDEELECFLNDRREHVRDVIAPALERGALVIVDRYYYSTVAYQGARGIDPPTLLARNREFAPVPDLVVLMDLDPRQGLERIGTRGAGRDAFESAATLTAAQAIFDTMREPHVAHFDATQSVGDLHALILGRVLPLLGSAAAA
jgi:dTMP kinase